LRLLGIDRQERDGKPFHRLRFVHAGRLFSKNVIVSECAASVSKDLRLARLREFSKALNEAEMDAGGRWVKLQYGENLIYEALNAHPAA
jgi:hypothetical protein